VLYVRAVSGKITAPNGIKGCYAIPGLPPSLEKIGGYPSNQPEQITISVRRLDLPLNRVGNYEYTGVWGSYDGNRITVGVERTGPGVWVTADQYRLAVALFYAIMRGSIRPKEAEMNSDVGSRQSQQSVLVGTPLAGRTGSALGC
jgi:hypothetical protein